MTARLCEPCRGRSCAPGSAGPGCPRQAERPLHRRQYSQTLAVSSRARRGSARRCSPLPPDGNPLLAKQAEGYRRRTLESVGAGLAAEHHAHQRLVAVGQQAAVERPDGCVQGSATLLTGETGRPGRRPLPTLRMYSPNAKPAGRSPARAGRSSPRSGRRVYGTFSVTELAQQVAATGAVAAITHGAILQSLAIGEAGERPERAQSRPREYLPSLRSP